MIGVLSLPWHDFPDLLPGKARLYLPRMPTSTSLATGESTAGMASDSPPSGSGPTALERHVAYFDAFSEQRGTGRIRLWSTVKGIRALGPGPGLSFALALLIHVFLGPITNRGLRLSIDAKRIARGVHPGDTGIFDAEGHFAPKVFDQLWDETLGAEAAQAKTAAITKAEFLAFMKAHGKKSRVGGWFSNAEATLLFCVAADAYRDVAGKLVPAMSRSRLRAFYAGTLLPAVARLRRLPSRRAREDGSSQRNRRR